MRNARPQILPRLTELPIVNIRQRRSGKKYKTESLHRKRFENKPDVKDAPDKSVFQIAINVAQSSEQSIKTFRS